jgi:lycopene cyclase domain-containing protein
MTIFFDMFVTRNSLLSTLRFWLSYAIIFPFQLATNWWLTSREIVMYNPDAIIGLRLAGAPIEDLIFGFAMILAVMSLWETRMKGISKT